MTPEKREINWLLKEKYNGKITKSAWKDLHKLKSGDHIDYLIGFVDFLDCRIDLSRRPLIPRPETEYWVNKSISDLKANESSRVLLDLFSGSGCIGIALLRALPASKVTFADVSDACIDQIKINCEINNINPKRYRIIKSNVFSNIQGKYDRIFANPPYIPTNSKNIENSVLINEPANALFGGRDGLIYIKEFLSEAGNFLENEGKIYMEFDSQEKNAIEDLLIRYDYENWIFYKDQFKKWRYLMAQTN